MGWKVKRVPKMTQKIHKRSRKWPKNHQKPQKGESEAKYQKEKKTEEMRKRSPNCHRKLDGWQHPHGLARSAGWPQRDQRSRLTPGYDKTSSTSPWEGHQKITTKKAQKWKNSKTHNIWYQREIPQIAPQWSCFAQGTSSTKGSTTHQEPKAHVR